MQDFATGQGYYLAELVKHYHELRAPYLKWAEATFSSKSQAVAIYQKSLLAWYESRIQQEDPYTGDVMLFLQAATAGYTNTLDAFRSEWAEQGFATLRQNPITFLPRGIHLQPHQQQMLSAFRDMDQEVKDLLLLSYYHQLSDHRIHKVLNVGKDAADATRQRRRCLRLLRDDWQKIGLLDKSLHASPEQQEVVDRFLRGELAVAQRWEVEARRTNDALFRESLQLREDWQDCLRLVGRQDTLETLKSEEKTFEPKVKLEPKRMIRSFNFGWLQTSLLVALAGILMYLLYTTFGPTDEKELFTAYFRPFPNITQVNNSDKKPDPLEAELDEMLIPYDRKDYRTAYDELLPAATAYPSAPLYLGVCALALNQPQRAIDWLNHYLPGDKYHPYSRWYISLAYLAQDRRNAALDELVEIASISGHPYEAPATRLIEALE